jgi:hypothetical protein
MPTTVLPYEHLNWVNGTFVQDCRFLCAKPFVVRQSFTPCCRFLDAFVDDANLSLAIYVKPIDVTKSKLSVTLTHTPTMRFTTKNPFRF